MSTKDVYTVLPQLVNNQINNANRNLNVNLGGIREVFEEGVQPIGLSELGNSMDSQIKPAPATIRFFKEMIDGKMFITLSIEHSGQDDAGHQINHRLVCDIYRDKNEDGLFQDNEFVGSVDLQVSRLFKDTDTPKNKIVRYKALVKDLNTGLSSWSAPVPIDTTDNLIPYSPNTFSIITQGIRTDNEGNICNAMLKVEKHYDDDLLKLEVYYRPKDGTTEWMKQPDIDNNTLVQTESGTEYWIQYLTNLTKGAFYEIYLRAVRKSGNKSDDTAIVAFRAGDFVAPERPRNVIAMNLTEAGSPLIEVHFKRPATAYEDIYRYNIYRYTWSVAGGAFVEDNPTQIGYVTNDPLKEDFVYQDTTVVVNSWYVYMVIALDSSDAHNPSSPAFSSQIQATEESDSDLISISFLPSNANNFPFTIDWTFPATDTHFFIQMRENDNAARRVLWQGYVPSTVFTKTLSLDDFTVQNAKDFMDIVAWQTSDNYAIEVFAANKNAFTGIVSLGAKLGTETFLINPKPPDVTGFTAVYDPVTHLIENKWNGTSFYSLSGYEIRLTDLAGYNTIVANPGTSQSALEAKNTVWNAGTVIPTPLATRKNITSWRFAPPANVLPSQTDPVSYYFMIKAVGDIFQTYVYRSTEITKAIYSADTAVAVGTVLDLLIAPTVSNVPPYSAVLVGNKMNVTWLFTDTRQVKEFRLYMSDIATDLTTDPPDDSLIVYKGRVSTAVVDQLANGTALSFDKTYYFKVYAVDHYGYLGRPSTVFNNLPAVTQFANLPQPKITGEGFVSAQPFPTSAQTPPPLSQAIMVDVFNSRSVMFEVESFTKDPYSDRIQWYMSVNDGAYTLVKETKFTEDLRGVAGVVPKITQSYSSPTDLTLFRIIAVQASPNKSGRLATAVPSKYSKIDTEKPSIEITKITYTSATGNNAINKNNYINKNCISNGIFVSYLAYEKSPNSLIKSVEYSVGRGAWATVTTPVLNITAAELGADTDINGIYRDISLTLMATDNANNKEVVTVVFRKDTVGPEAPAIPTSISYSVGRTIKFKWTNPTTTNRNLFDGVIFRIAGDEKEYRRTDGIFEYTPESAPSNISVKMYAVDIADNELELGSWTISNAAPKAPTGITTNASVGAVTANWAAVTQDTNDMDEDVRGYKVDYAISATQPIEGSGLWTEAVAETASINHTLAFTAAQMDQLSADSSLNVWLRVKAIDYWGLAGAYGTAMSAKPRTVTAVDMGGNIFKMKLTTNMANTGLTDYILDANFIDAQYCGFTNSAITDYIKLDLTKTEWISEIKLKFRHPSTVKFLFKFEEVSGATVTTTWMYSAGSHTFGTAGSIVISATPPGVNDYFEFTTQSADIADIARLFDQNFSTGKPILANSVTMYLYNATGSVDIVEFQPIIKSIANVFYGNEVNLDTMVSIRSKTAYDTGNYLAMDRYGIKIWAGGVDPTIIFGKQSDNTYGLTISSSANSTRGTINITQTEAGSVSSDYWSPNICYGSTLNPTYSVGFRAIADADNNSSLQSLSSLRIARKNTSGCIYFGMRIEDDNNGTYPTGVGNGTSVLYLAGNIQAKSGNTFSCGIVNHITNIVDSGGFFSDRSYCYFGTNSGAGSSQNWSLKCTSDYNNAYLTISASTNVKIGTLSTYIGDPVIGFLMNANQNTTLGATDLAGSSYRLYVNGLSRFADTVYFGSTYYINNSGYIYTSAIYSTSYVQTGSLYISGTSYYSGGSRQLMCYALSDTITIGFNDAYNNYQHGFFQIGNNSGDITMASSVKATFTANMKFGRYINSGGAFYLNGLMNREGNWSFGGTNTASVTDIAASNTKVAIDASAGSDLYYGLVVKPYSGGGSYVGLYMYNATGDHNCINVTNGSGFSTTFSENKSTGLGGYFKSAGTYALRSDGGSYLNGIVYVPALGAATTGTVLVLDAGNTIKPQSSSARYKEDIQNLTKYSINKLRPVMFTWIESKEKSCGFIAEEMEKVMPDMVIKKDGKPESIKYIDIIAILTKELQNSNKRQKKQRKEINELKNRLNALELLLTNLHK